MLRRWLLVTLALGLVGCRGAGDARFGSAPITDGMLAGMIRTADTGAAVDDAVVVLRRQGELAPVQERTNATGAYMIPRLAPGRYQIKVYRDQRTVGEEVVAILAGRVTGLDFALGPRLTPSEGGAIDVASGGPLWRFRPANADPAQGAIEGTVTEHGERTRLEGAVVTVVDGDGRLVADAVSDERGRYRCDPLAPGTYVVSAYYTLLGRGQFEIRRSQVVVGGGEVVVVPLAIETDSR